MKSRKAVASDKLPVLMQKALGENGVQQILGLFNKITWENKIPDVWSKCYLVPIFINKGNVQEGSGTIEVKS